MTPLRFDLRDPPPGAAALRAEVRAFLAEAGRDWTPEVRARSWGGFDRGFARAVAARGWIGMTWPAAYGGGGRSALDRYVVLEELLAAGAPVAAFWIGDRQSGPLLLRRGTEAQRRAILPGIVRGELAFCIGLSEPDSGSDLASLRTRAERQPDGSWRLNGRKVWTSNAQVADWMIALVRTGPPPDAKARHAGLSQFLVDMRLSGITVRPIADLTGDAHFNEVTFDDVRLPADALVGREGEGWAQATAELAFERAGPERYLSSWPLLTAALDGLEHGQAPEAVGRLLARAATLRQMSFSIAGMLDEGRTPEREAALVKECGNAWEQALPEVVRGLLPEDGPSPAVARMLAVLTQVSPSFSLRGGTREILRGIIARQLGLR